MLRILQKLFTMFSILLTAIFSNVALAETSINDQTVIGRYLTVTNQALPAQSDLLTQTFQVRFPHSIKTMGDAMHYLLRLSGYSLINQNDLPTEAKALLVQPLPQVDRSFGPMTLQDGLLTLAGKSFGLLVDPVHRLISLRLLPPYQSLYQTPKPFALWSFFSTQHPKTNNESVI